ncbi:hypothetical protein GF357_02380 [Candidatus Dojkabacteria bacterium]|nr:hypothetical protein [Candidatus Dojkabacteria bacterium]
MRNLKDYIKRNELVLVWGVAFVLLIILLVVALIFQSDPGDEVSPVVRDNSVNQAFNKTSGYIDSDSEQLVVRTDSQITEKITKMNSAGVYEIKNVDFEGIVENFIESNKISGWEKQGGQSVTVWNNPKEFNSYLSLVKPVYKLNLNFETPLQLSKVPTAIVTEETVKDHFSEVIAAYFGANWRYTNIQVENLEMGSLFKVIANRDINGKPLYCSESYNELYDYMIFNSSGDLLRGKITYLDAGVESQKQYQLLDPMELGDFVNVSAANRIVYSGRPQHISGDEYDWNQYPHFDYDIGEDGPFPELTQCETNKAELGYMYLDSEIKKIYPIYAIHCSQQVTYQNGVYEIPAIVLVDAIDPAYIK